MPESVNPLVPAWYDIVWSGAAAIVFILLVISLISIARAAKSLTSLQALTWTLVAIFVPVVGPLTWLFIGRRSRGMSTSA